MLSEGVWGRLGLLRRLIVRAAVSFAVIIVSSLAGVGFGRFGRAVVPFVHLVGWRLVLVLVVLRVRFRFVWPLGRHLVMVGPVEIWPKIAKLAQ